MKQQSFNDEEGNTEGFLSSIMLLELYSKFWRAHPEMSLAESFVTFFASVGSFKDLEEMVDEERRAVGKAQFDLIMVVIEAHEILNGRAGNFT